MSLHRSGGEGQTGGLLVRGCVRSRAVCCWFNSLFLFPQLGPGSLLTILLIPLGTGPQEGGTNVVPKTSPRPRARPCVRCPPVFKSQVSRTAGRKGPEGLRNGLGWPAGLGL